MLIFGLFILLGVVGIVQALETTITGSSNFGGEYILSEEDNNYVLYVIPTYGSVDPSEIYITAGFKDLDELGGANRVNSWSNHPDNRFTIVFTLYALTGAYKIGEIPLTDLDLYNTIEIRFDYGDEFTEWRIPLDEISIGTNSELKPQIRSNGCEDAGYNCRDASCPQGIETRVWDSSCSYIGGRPQICCRTFEVDESRGECIDSDNGNNPDVEGEIYNSVENYEDFCLVAGGTFKYVEEYYCEDGLVKSETVECTNRCSDGACRGELSECLIEEGEGICEFMGKSYAIKHSGCNEDVSLEISYDDELIRSVGRKQGGINSVLLNNGVLIKVQSSPCAEYLVELSFNDYRESKIITDYGWHDVYPGDRINFDSVDAEIDDIFWALSGDTTPTIKIRQYPSPIFYLKQNEGRIFTYGAISNPTVSNVGIKILSFALDEGSPTMTHSTIELFPVEAEQVLNPTEEGEEVVERDFSTQDFFCNGCELENGCYFFGYRKSEGYCSESREFADQLSSGEYCDNNFDCKSNVCVADECISQGLLKRIIEWFRNLFGISV